jgi:acyl carrier protein
MVPSAFVTLDHLPLTPNGKVDRRALPAPEYAGSAVHTAPRDETEQRIARVWAEVLGVEEVGVEDNFFDLGGDSLLLMRVYTRLGDTLKPGLTTVDLFRHPTVRSLAEHLAGAGGAADAGARRDAIREGKSRVQQLLAQKKRNQRDP